MVNVKFRRELWIYKIMTSVFDTHPPLIYVTISSVKEIRFCNRYPPTFYVDVTKYTVFFLMASLRVLQERKSVNKKKIVIFNYVVWSYKYQILLLSFEFESSHAFYVVCYTWSYFILMLNCSNLLIFAFNAIENLENLKWCYPAPVRSVG